MSKLAFSIRLATLAMAASPAFAEVTPFVDHYKTNVATNTTPANMASVLRNLNQQILSM